MKLARYVFCYRMQFSEGRQRPGMSVQSTRYMVQQAKNLPGMEQMHPLTWYT